MEVTDMDASPEEALLLCARQGQITIIQELVKSKQQGNITLDINCKGKQKSNRGWTPLHLAAYFGHADVVKLLLEAGGNVNVVNNVGDTPLHRAAFTGRVDIVTLLLTKGADVSVRNAEGETPRSAAQDKDVIELLEAAEKHENNILEEEFMSSVREGDISKVEDMVVKGKLSDLNFCDNYGNTALHLAAQAEQRQMAVYLLQHGVDTGMKNRQGLKAADIARTQQMKQLLNVKPRTSNVSVPQRYEGILLKRSALFGKTAMWVVAERGVLSYFKNRGDASTGAKRRGMKYLDEASLKIAEDNGFDFLVQFSDGAIHRLSTDPACKDAVTRQRWINTLKDHIAYSTHYIHKGGPKEEQESNDSVPKETIQDALKMAQAHQNVLETQVQQLSDYIHRDKNNSCDKGTLEKLNTELQKVVEYSQDMTSALNKCLVLFTQQEELRVKQLHDEMEKGRVLQEALHALALEHHELEKSYSRNSVARSYATDDDEFYDCDNDDEETMTYFRRPQSPSASSNMDAVSFKSCMFDLNMEDQDSTQLNDDIEYYHIDLKGREKVKLREHSESTYLHKQL